MSAISSLTSSPLQDVTSPSTTVTSGTSNPFAEVTSEEWLGIILEELSNQDPFEPNDTSATLEQLNSLRSIESDISLQDQLESLVLQNSIGQAGSLIGRQVEGLSTLGLNVTGVVESVRVADGQSQLQLESGSTVDFNNVTNVSSIEAAAEAPPAGLGQALGVAPVVGSTTTADAAAAVPTELIQALAGLDSGAEQTGTDTDADPDEDQGEAAS